MVSNTKEIALEQAIQRHLTGLVSEELAGPLVSGPYAPADPRLFRLRLPTAFDAGPGAG